MRKIKLLFLIVFFPAFVFSQGVEIVPFAGYMFGGSVKYTQGKLDLDNGMNYGASLLVPIETILDVEINYTRMESTGSFSPYAGFPGYDYLETDIATNYIQIGGIKKLLPPGSKAQPFGSFAVGATWFTADSYSDVWRFSVTAGLGVKVMLSDKVGIMLRGRLMMPMTFGGASFYLGTGGSGAALNAWVAPFQGDFNGGLIFKVGQ
jgi:hypothetical protein